VFVKLANTGQFLGSGNLESLFIPIEPERNLYFRFDCFLRANRYPPSSAGRLSPQNAQ
jgi:hypothetical protein